MSEVAPLRFSMKSDSTHWYYWDGSLQTSASAVYLPHSPIGWQNTDMKWRRSETYRGLIRSVSGQFEFVEDGASILRSVYYNGSVESKVYFIIEKRSVSGYAYEPFFSGEIDLFTFVDGLTSVKANVEEGGLAAKLYAAANTPYEIPITGGDAVQAYLDGLVLQATVNYVVVSGALTPVDPALRFAFTTYHSLTEGDYNIGTPDNMGAGSMGSGGYTAPEFGNEALLMGVSGEIDFHWEGDVHFFKNNPAYADASFQLRLQIIPDNASGPPYGTTANHLVYTSPVLTTNDATYSVNATLTGISVSAGDRLFIVFTIATVGPAGVSMYQYQWTDGLAWIKVRFRLPATLTKAFRYIDGAQALADLISGSSSTLVSDYLSDTNSIDFDNRPYHTLLTSGDALRQLDEDTLGNPKDPALRLTWGDLWKDAASRWQLGMAIRNEQIVINPLAEFFDESTVIADLGEVRDLTIEVAKEYYFSQLSIGYQNQTYDNLNGRDEYNTTHTYKYPFTRDPKPQDLVSPFRADSYGIEYTRANLSGKKTTDSKSDNETFLIEVDTTTTSGGFDLYRPQNDPGNSASGMIDPATAYNLALSPKRNLMRNGAMIRSFLLGRETENVEFQVTDKNAEVESDLGWGTIVETTGPQVGTLNDPLYKPILFHFTAITPINMASLMNSSPDGCFEFTWQGETYKGFPLEVGIKGAFHNTYDFTLLCTPNTDVSPLIR